jgi:putative inorganic carbon (hco3(-)) transporter
MFESIPKKAGFRVRLSPVIIYVLLIFLSIGIGIVTAKKGIFFGVLINVLLIGVPVCLYMIQNIKFGIIVLIIYSFFLARIGHFLSGDIPLGVVIDAFLLFLLIGVIFRKVKRNDFSIASGPVSVMVWLWLIYNVLQFFNPMQSKEAWIYVIRGMAGHMIFYFIVLEALDSFSFLKKIINVWIILALLGALYGLFQEFHGLTLSEKAWVMADDERFKLFYNWGKYRIFSFFNDPTVFGILMAFTSVFCLTLSNGPFKFTHKIALLICSGVMLLASLYSGTRTAYALIPAGVGMFSLITFQKRILIFTSIVFVVAAFIIFSDIKSVGPLLSTNSLTRIRSTFNPSEDPSYQVRLENQAKIKPFVLSHPIGAGLGSVGATGGRFNPNSVVAGFAPDSMYVKIAVELGWVGLFLYCVFLTIVLVIAVKNYYRIKNQELKIYSAALFAVIYSICVANYPQIAAGQLPSVFIFYAMIAIIVKLPELDQKLTQ